MWNESVVIYLKVKSMHLPEGTGKPLILPGQPSPGRHLNPRSPEYEAGVLITQPRISVPFISLMFLLIYLYLLFFSETLLIFV
jgi:hypothetical protein